MKKILLAVLFVLSGIMPVSATKCYWTAASPGQWDSASNWLGGVIPNATTDTAFFMAANSVQNCSLKVAKSAQMVRCSLYTGTIIASALLTITNSKNQRQFGYGSDEFKFAGVGTFLRLQNNAAVACTVGNIRSTSTGDMNVRSNTGGANSKFIFNKLILSGKFTPSNSSGGFVVHSFQGDSVKCTTMEVSAGTAGYIDSLQFNATIVSIGTVTYTTITNGNAVINYGTSKWIVSGNWTNSPQILSVDVGTSLVVSTGNAIYTSAGKQFYDLTVNNASTGSFRIADSLSLLGDFTLTDGRDSLIEQVRCVDYTNNTTDSVFLDANLFLSGAFVRGAGTKVRRLAGAMIFTGAATQPITTNGNIVGVFHSKKTAGILQPTDSLNIGVYLDSSTATWDMDYGMRCSTAVWAMACSVAQSGRMEIVKDLSYGLQVKENITGPTAFIGGVAGTWRDSGVTVGDVEINKTAGIALTTVGKTNGGDLTVTSGKLIIGTTAADTGRWADMVFNNVGAGDTVTLNADQYVSGSFSCAAGVVFAGTGKIIATAGTHVFTLNGNATIPKIINKGKIQWR